MIGIGTSIAKRNYPSSSSVAPFSPLDIAGLQAWYNMSAANLTKDGSNNISQINDLSGNANHVTQVVGANQPLWVDAVLNGKPIARFSGLSSIISNATLTLAQPMTMFFVFKFSSDPGLLNNSPIGGKSTDAAVFRRAYAASPMPIAISGNTGQMNGTTLLAKNVFYLGEAIFNGAISKIFINGVQDDDGANPGNAGLTELNLGNVIPNGSLLGDLAEALVYDSSLSNVNRASVETYLNTKYAIY